MPLICLGKCPNASTGDRLKFFGKWCEDRSVFRQIIDGLFSLELRPDGGFAAYNGYRVGHGGRFVVGVGGWDIVPEPLRPGCFSLTYAEDCRLSVRLSADGDTMVVTGPNGAEKKLIRTETWTGRFREGRPDGEWKVRDKKGTILQTLRYRDGRLVDITDRYGRGSGELEFWQEFQERARRQRQEKPEVR
jgi:hypothetical protein